MKTLKQTFWIAIVFGIFFSGNALSQTAGDYRSAGTGNWSEATTWETFDGTNWIAASNAPTGTENITVDGTDTVRVDVAVSITGFVKVVETGIIEVAAGSLEFGNGSTYEHARDAGSAPLSTWSQGSTFLLTGTVQDAPANRNQNFYNFNFNTPNLGRNRDMGWNGITIGGDVRVISTGANRWQMTSVAANDTAAFTVMGDVIVEAGNFAVQGTGNALTTFIVNHYGDINVTGGNFSLARGSQGSGTGTTTWFLYEGNLSMSNATTQNSNPTQGNAKFVFAKNDTQQVTFENVTYGGGRIHFEVADSSTMQITQGFVVNGNLVNRGAVVPLDTLKFASGSVYEHARDGGSVPTAVWQEGSTALFTGITGTAPENRGQDYYNLTLNTPGLLSNRDLDLDGHTLGGDITVISTGAARWQLVGGSSGTVTIMGDVIVQAGQFATQGTGSATNVVIDHYGDVNVTGGNFSVSRGSQSSGTGTTTWNLHEGNFSMSNAATQNSNPTPGNAKFVFAKESGVQNITLSNVTYGGGGLPIQVDSAATLNMDTTAVGGNGFFAVSAGATLQTALAGGLDSAIVTTGVVSFSKQANFTFNGTVAQVPGALLPDTVGVLTIWNPAGVSFSDTLRSSELVVASGSVMRIDSLGSVTTDSGSVAGTVVNKGELASVAPLVFADGSVYEHARDGGSMPAAVWQEGSTALFTGITGTAPENRGQDYYDLTLNTPGLASNRDFDLDGHTIGGDITVISTGAARWQLVGGTSGAVTIMGDVIVQAGQFTTQGTGSATNVVVDHYGDVNVTGGNFSVSRGSQSSGTGTTTWNLHEGNFSMSNATTQNSNPTAGNAKFVFAKEGGAQNITLTNVTYGGGGLPIQVDSAATLNMDTTAVGGNGVFNLSAFATLVSGHPNGVDGNLQTTGVISLSKHANFTYNGIVAQVAGALLPDTLGVLTVWNPVGVSFTDTLRSAALAVSSGAIMRIDSLGSVTADSGSISGTVVNKGVLASVQPLVFATGSVYEHARNEGSIPSGVWNEGSTLLMTGTTTTAPANRNQSYYNITFNTPNMISNLDMSLNSVTIGGNIWVVNTGVARWRLTSAAATDTAIVTIMGDVNVEGGSFETQGTGNAQTVFEVHHYGDVAVTGGNFSVARGSQGNGSGSTRWFMHDGNFSISNATTQNSNATNARFVFDKAGVQTIALSSVTYGGGGLPIEVANGTTLDFGVSELGGAGVFMLDDGATLATAHAGGIAGAVQATGILTFDDGASYIFNGTAAQVTSLLMPTTVNGLTINNAAGVVLSQATTINGVLRLVAGVFDNTIPFTLGPNGSISLEGGSLAIPVSVEQLPEVPTEFALLQNYPNPFNPTTTIEFHLPMTSHVKVSVYNAQGQLVATLVDGQLATGVYKIPFAPANLSSGLYFYKIAARDFTEVKKMILVK